jgi:hypothetical protein
MTLTVAGFLRRFLMHVLPQVCRLPLAVDSS